MRRKKFGSVLLSLLLVGALSFGISQGVPARAANPNCTAIDGDYIVTFNRTANVKAELNGAPGRPIAPQFVFDAVLNGFSASLSAEQVCAFQKRPNIQFVEPDLTVQSQATTQSLDGTVWGLDRIDEPAKLLDSSYEYLSSGSGISVYVVDTGIKSAHVDFAGRVAKGFSAIKGSSSTEDCNGHGTHVSGTIAGTVYGVAKSSTLVPVRVLDCKGSGSNSGVIAGLNWIAKNAVSGKSVVNMSLGGGASATLDAAVNNVISKGVVVVVAAGNSAANACNYSPSRVPNAITVAASDSNDNFANFSNYGSCVDIVAPGVGIKSDWFNSTIATNTISGTSMASPHVAGAVARYLSNSANQSQLINDAKPGISLLPTGTPNLFLYLDPAK